MVRSPALWVALGLALACEASAPEPAEVRAAPVEAAVVEAAPAETAARHEADRRRRETGFAEPLWRPGPDENPNCSERRGRMTPVTSREHAVELLRGGLPRAPEDLTQWIKLDDFRAPRATSMQNGELVGAGPIDWAAVGRAIAIEEAGGVTTYSLEFTPMMCGEYMLRMTDRGFVSLRGCCGK
ncbi:MAG: hypothetical protein R3B09_26590 [Nannocystaceae bacterium]